MHIGTLSPETATGACIRYNVEHSGLEIVFPTHPGPEMIQRIRDAGFRWHGKARVWYQTYSPAAEALAYDALGLTPP